MHDLTLEEMTHKIAMLEAQAKIDRLELEAAHTQAEIDKLTKPAGVAIRPKPLPKLPKLPDEHKTAKALAVLEAAVPKYIKGLQGKSVHQFSDFQRWIIGASKKSGWFKFIIEASPKSTLRYSVPFITNISPILEIQSRLNYYHKINDFVAKPRSFLRDQELGKIEYAKGDPIIIHSVAEDQDYIDFFDTFQFDHYVFWQYQKKDTNSISKVAIAIVFRAHKGYLPDLDKLDQHMPNFTRSDLPSIRFSSGGFKDTEKQEDYRAKLEMFPQIL